MGSKWVTNIPALCSAMLLLLAGSASSDFNQDKAECANKLVGLASCLPYVEGQAKAPTLDCCTGMKEVLAKSKKCVCVLIKDRDDPNLGIKINTTLALQLPSACHASTNITECVDLLHLPPNSPEAKVFEGFQNATEKNSSTPTPSANNATGGAGHGSSSSSQDKSSGGLGKRWLVEAVVCGISPFVFIWHFFFLV